MKTENNNKSKETHVFMNWNLNNNNKRTHEIFKSESNNSEN